jgi:hypothetical protein
MPGWHSDCIDIDASFRILPGVGSSVGEGEFAMSRKSPTGFVTGLVAEIAIIAAVVSLLPRVPLGRAAPVTQGEIADERPSLVPLPEPLPPPSDDWRTAVGRPVEAAIPLPLDLPPADPVYVEKRLDKAGQQLLEGVSRHLSRQAQELLQTPPTTDQTLPAPRSAAPTDSMPSQLPANNRFRY